MAASTFWRHDDDRRADTLAFFDPLGTPCAGFCDCRALAATGQAALRPPVASVVPRVDVINNRLDSWAFHEIEKTIVDENNMLEDI